MELDILSVSTNNGVQMNEENNQFYKEIDINNSIYEHLFWCGRLHSVISKDNRDISPCSMDIPYKLHHLKFLSETFATCP